MQIRILRARTVERDTKCVGISRTQRRAGMPGMKGTREREKEREREA